MQNQAGSGSLVLTGSARDIYTYLERKTHSELHRLKQQHSPQHLTSQIRKKKNSLPARK